MGMVRFLRGRRERTTRPGGGQFRGRPKKARISAEASTAVLGGPPGPCHAARRGARPGMRTAEDLDEGDARGAAAGREVGALRAAAVGHARDGQRAGRGGAGAARLRGPEPRRLLRAHDRSDLPRRGAVGANQRVCRAMDQQHGDRASAPAALREPLSRGGADDGDAGEDVRRLAGQPRGHEAAIRHPRDIHARRIGAVPCDERADQRAQEGDVVHALAIRRRLARRSAGAAKAMVSAMPRAAGRRNAAASTVARRTRMRQG
jgi:hypothetical protein